MTRVRDESRMYALRRSTRGLVRVSRLRIVEATILVIFAMIGALFVGVDLKVVAATFVACALLGLVGDHRVRRAAARSLGPNPSTASPLAVQRAVRDAARPLGIDDRTIFPRHVKGRGEAQHVGFAAGALPVPQGAMVLMGDVVAERTRDAASKSATEGERRFAYDEIRAVLGHELAHIMPGTHSSDRLPAVVVRMSSRMFDVMFWAAVAMVEPRIGLAGAVVVGGLRLLVMRKPTMRGVVDAVNALAAIGLTVFVSHEYALGVAYLVWPFVRPLSELAIQRRIEHWCDRVAVSAGADPSALARMLQRFEPEVLRYYQPPLWVLLNATHPPLHKRIVDLDHSSDR